MKESIPKELSYAMAVAELVLNMDGQSDKLVGEKLNALRKSWSLLEYYEAQFFDGAILDAIMEKKAKMILGTTNIQDIRALGNPPTPCYDGNSFSTAKNSVPEEEMIWWSMASQRAPLVHKAFERYMELLKAFYGKSIDEIIEKMRRD